MRITPAPTTLTGEELYYLRGLLNAGGPGDGYRARLEEVSGDARRRVDVNAPMGCAAAPDLRQLLLRILEQEQQSLARWGVDYADLATKVDSMTADALHELYADLEYTRLDVTCVRRETNAYDAAGFGGLSLA